ncbi:MAG: hypothetical protein HRK26_02285 [Rickettsiaceae bacterium H1]|nr:hypothetical protein [Rickettsiaceae bacterium H1]
MIKKHKNLIREIFFFFLSVSLSTLVLTLNFLYGREKIKNFLFLPAILITHLSLSFLTSRSIYGRLHSTNSSIQISNTLDSLTKNKQETTTKKQTGYHVKKTMSIVILLQIISVSFNVIAPFFYKNQKIGNIPYLFMILTAYALSTAVTTLFTYNRIQDRKLKRSNNQKVQSVTNSATEQAVVNKDGNLSFTARNRIELGVNFLADTITRASEIILNFLYSASKINMTIFIGIMVGLRIFDLSIITYSTYDRFSTLKLVEKDNEQLKSKLPSENHDEITKSNLPLMMTLFFMTSILSITGKITVPVLYRQNIINTLAYLTLTFVSIMFSSFISFIFNINRKLDENVTKQNLALVEALVQEKIQK